MMELTGEELKALIEKLRRLSTFPDGFGLDRIKACEEAADALKALALEIPCPYCDKYGKRLGQNDIVINCPKCKGTHKKYWEV